MLPFIHSCRPCPNLHDTIKSICCEWIGGIDRSLWMRTACENRWKSVRMTKCHFCVACFIRSVSMRAFLCRRHSVCIVRYKAVSYPGSRIRLKCVQYTSTACERVSTHCISNSWPKYVIGSYPRITRACNWNIRIYDVSRVCARKIGTFISKDLTRLSICSVTRRKSRMYPREFINVSTHWTLYQTKPMK